MPRSQVRRQRAEGRSGRRARTCRLHESRAESRTVTHTAQRSPFTFGPLPHYDVVMRQAVWQHAKKMWELGLVAGSAGNVSERVAGDPSRIAITPTSVPYESLCE